MPIEFEVNGTPHALDVDPRETLLTVLRDELGLRGTKYGCGEGECGACTVLMDGKPVTACMTMVGRMRGHHVTTIEAIDDDPTGRRLVRSFAAQGAVQCGFCSPGFVLIAHHLLTQDPAPTRQAAREAVAGNLCRCTGYTKIVDAIVGAGVSADPDAVMSESGVHLASPAAQRHASSREFARPKTIDDVLALLADSDAPRLVCGSTDVSVQFEHELKRHTFIDVTAVDALNFVRDDDDAVVIGAATPYVDIIGSPLVDQWAPVLVSASKEVGAGQIQNLGSLGGNLANASPSADGVAALVVLGAQVVIRSMAGERTVPVTEIARGPGQTTLRNDELISEIVIPKDGRSAGARVSFFEKLGPRRMQTIAIASVACNGERDDGRLKAVRIALGAVAPTIVRAPEAEALLTSAPLTPELVMEAGSVASRECSPIDDIRGSAAYRRQLVRGLLIRGLWPYTHTAAGPA